MTRKISARKIIQAVLTIVLLTVCVVAVLSASRVQNDRKIKAIAINIQNDQYGFVTKQDVKDALLHNGEYNVGVTALTEVNVKQVEKLIKANLWVERAQVYIDNDHVLHASVEQKVPVVRIFEQNGMVSYYLDKNMEAFPVSEQYSHYTTVVINVPELRNDSASLKLKTDIMAVVKLIQKDTFWNAQVSQVIVRDDRKFEIVPVLGNQQIIIGDANDLQQKFDNLFAFYTKVLNEVGWDKYEVLDMSYKGQMVASPAVNWNLPKDRVMERINWVNSISDEAGKTSVVNNVLTRALQMATPKVEEKPVVKDTVVATVKKVEPVAKKEPVKKEVTAKKPVEVKKAVVEKPVLAAKKKEVIKKEVKKKEVKPVKVVEKKKEKKQKKEHTEVAVKEEQEKKPKYIYTGSNN